MSQICRKITVKIRKKQEMKQSLTITKSGVTTWITPLSYDILIVAYLFLLHLLEVGVLNVVGFIAACLLASGLLLTALIGVTTGLTCGTALLVHLG